MTSAVGLLPLAIHFGFETVESLLKVAPNNTCTVYLFSCIYACMHACMCLGHLLICLHACMYACMCLGLPRDGPALPDGPRRKQFADVIGAAFCVQLLCSRIQLRSRSPLLPGKLTTTCSCIHMHAACTCMHACACSPKCCCFGPAGAASLRCSHSATHDGEQR